MKAATSPVVRSLRSDSYERDFLEWSQHTAALLRRRQFSELDIEHAAEEIEDMGKRDVDELCSRMEVLISHLLKWQSQPHKRSRSWRTTVLTQRLEIQRLLRRSPSLRRHLVAEAVETYKGAIKRAATETGLSKDQFPTTCPFSSQQILDEDFLPS